MGGTDRSTSLRSDERSTSLKSVFHIPEIGVPLHRNTHVVQNKVEAAYARSDLFERRRLLMDDWVEYLAGKGR